MVPYGTIWCHWYHMIPYGTIWYHRVPYDPPQRSGETLLGRQDFFGFLTFGFFQYQITIQKTSTLIKYEGILTFRRLEKNPRKVSVILVQKSLEADNSESSYDTFWFQDG